MGYDFEVRPDDENDFHREKPDEAKDGGRQMGEDVKACDIRNSLHVPKLLKAAQRHIEIAKAWADKARSERRNNAKQASQDGSKGINVMSKATGGNGSKPLLYVKRDEECFGGGRPGTITTNPKEVDGIVRRAWQQMYDGSVANIDETVRQFAVKHGIRFFKDSDFDVENIDGEMVFKAFRNTAASAAGMDGWEPKEFTFFSKRLCEHVADLLALLEAGAPWPDWTTHARIVHLEKEGCIAGGVMSYRPLTITSALYRRWATMRLRTIDVWIATWATPHMFAGVVGQGAVDVW